MNEFEELLLLAGEKGTTADAKQFPLYPIDTPGRSFKEFLVHNRIRPFLQLHILNAMQGTVIVGHTSLKVFVPDYDNEDDPDKEIASYGPTILERTCSVEEVFESILANLGFSQIEAMNYIDKESRRRSKTGELLQFPHDTYTATEGETYILDNIALTSDAVYVSSEPLQKTVRDILAHHYQEFENLLQRQNDVGIPHSAYMELLLKWFPGKVKTRTLAGPQEE